MTILTEHADAEWLEIQNARRLAEEEYFQHRDLGNPLYYLDVLRDDALVEMRESLAARARSRQAAVASALTPAATAALKYILDRFTARAKNGPRLTDNERVALQTLRDTLQSR